MGEPKMNQKEKLYDKSEAPLKGTWFSVGVVGFVIFVTNLLLLWLYMSRL
ncbi:hypothetical protein [Evansella halocellulosilytica]|nr:hypothetical protein [Evansella halocellulosilytica]